MHGGARLFIRGNDAVVPIFPDVRTRPFPAERLHLYAAGPPCQPWAPGGRRQGADDPRAGLFYEALRLIYHNRPLCVILENSSLLFSYEGGAYLRRVLDLLTGWGYAAWASRIAAKECGLPTLRRRLYIVAMHEDLRAPAPVRPGGWRPSA